jgi:predicted Fe-S protein YdhL (DUF1289 family)
MSLDNLIGDMCDNFLELDDVVELAQSLTKADVKSHAQWLIDECEEYKDMVVDWDKLYEDTKAEVMRLARREVEREAEREAILLAQSLENPQCVVPVEDVCVCDDPQ